MHPVDIPRLDAKRFRSTIEEKLQVDLTDSYVALIESLIRERDPKAVAICCEIACDPQRVIEMNQLVERLQISDWPESYLAVGESGCGDFYAIDLDDEYTEVYFWNHESGSFEGDEDFSDLESFGESFLPSDA